MVARAVPKVVYDQGRKVCCWADIDWKRVKYNVRKLQSRIAKATQARKWRKVKRLTRLLTRSLSAKMLAVRKVVTNRGKNTPGTDGITWKTPKEKWSAIFEISPNGYVLRGERDREVPDLPDTNYWRQLWM